MPYIDWAKKIAYEGNVSIPPGAGDAERWGSAYDLALFEDGQKLPGLVLLATVNLNFKWEDGDEKSWETTEKKAFMNGFKTECEKAWSDKFRITKDAPVPGLALGTSRTVPNSAGSYSVARVAILINTVEQWSNIGTHGTITVYRETPKAKRIGVKDQRDVVFEKESLSLHTPSGGTKERRTVVHEFGHFLGYRDEYPGADRGTSAYTGDSDSIMHRGDAVRERHYVFFADWISERLNSSWKVEGLRNLSNTPL